MENLSLYSKILEIIILVFPSLVTLLILINRKFYVKNLNQLKDRFNIFEQKTQKNIKIILEKVEQQQQTLNKLLQNKTVAEKLRQVTKYAIQYCCDNNMNKILTNSTQHIIDFANSIIDQGFGNQTKQQLISRFELSRDNSLSYLKLFVSKQNYDMWVEMQKPISQGYVNALIEIYDDTINDKNTRFLVKTEDWLQTLTREFITFVSIIKQQGQTLCNQ